MQLFFKIFNPDEKCDSVYNVANFWQSTMISSLFLVSLYIYLCRQSWWKQWLICKTNWKFKTKEVFHCLRAITALCFLFFLNGCQLPVAFVARKLVSTELKATFLLLLILWSQKWTKCILNPRINCQWCAYGWCKKPWAQHFL